jgi:hypothetical protein
MLVDSTPNRRLTPDGASGSYVCAPTAQITSERRIHPCRCFLRELQTDYSYLKVPDDHVKAVEEFLKHIDEAPAVEAPQNPIGRPKLLAFQPCQEVEDESAQAS